MRMRKFLGVFLFSAVLCLPGCGGKDTTGALVLSVDATSVGPGTPVSVTATYTNPNTASKQNVPISFSTNNSRLFDNTSGHTDSFGTATALLTPKNGTTTPALVTITARTGDLVATQTVTVQPDTLTVTAPGDDSFSVKAPAAGSSVTFVPSGVFAVVRDGNGNPLQNKPVNISVSTIVNGSAGEYVTFWEDYPQVISNPPDTITITTDSNGVIPLQVTTTMFAPGPGGSNVLTVVWKLTTTTASGTLVGYASTLYTVTTEEVQA